MASKKHTGENGAALKYERVPSSGLKGSRKGRHHELIADILNDLATLPNGSAIQIPLNSVGGLSVASLRSAVVRGTSKQGIRIETSSDEKNFYIWKQAGQARASTNGR